METLSIDSGDVDSRILLSLGLKESRKGSLRTPRVLALLSSLLERCVQKNDLLFEKSEIKDIVTIFHGSRAPVVSIRQYVDRIFKYSGCSPSCFVVAQIYLDRYLKQADVHLTSFNVHRLLITSIMMAAKFIDDAFFNNAYYAKVGGVSTSEMNRLEMKFLFSIDFRLNVKLATFGRYCSQLEKESPEGLKIDWPIRSYRIKENWSSKGDYAPTIAR